MATALQSTTLHKPILSARYRPTAHVLWVRQGDATVLFDAGRGMYYTLNEVAGRTWELLVAHEPVIEILHCLGEEYEAAHGVLQDDLAVLIHELLAAGLIEESPS